MLSRAQNFFHHCMDFFIDRRSIKIDMRSIVLISGQLYEAEVKLV